MLIAGFLNIDETTFLAASMIRFIKVLHQGSIIIRDLNPDTIFIKRNGYACLNRLGAAKILRNDSDERFNTLVGTPHYMAVELIRKQPYSYPVDYWSLGITIFELLAGFVPFAQDTDDPIEIYETVLLQQLTFPPFLSKKEYEPFKDLISQCLEQNPKKRLVEGIEMLERHPVFRDFDWEALDRRTLESPLTNWSVLSDQHNYVQRRLASGLKLEDLLPSQLKTEAGLAESCSDPADWENFIHRKFGEG